MSIVNAPGQSFAHENSIQLNTGSQAMLTVAPDGFYVRGQKVPVDDQEALTVYHAFKQWLVWAQLTRT